MMVSGMINSFVAGRILDKTRKFKFVKVSVTRCKFLNIFFYLFKKVFKKKLVSTFITYGTSFHAHC